jgi:hypothetical protein
MPRGDYTPEIKKSLGTSKPGRVNTTPARKDPAAVVGRGVGTKEKDATTAARGATPTALPGSIQHPPGNPPQLPPASHAGGGTDVHHVAAATSIAHAILGHRGQGAF